MNEMTQIIVIDIIGNIAYANKNISETIPSASNTEAEWNINPWDNGFQFNGVNIDCIIIQSNF